MVLKCTVWLGTSEMGFFNRRSISVRVPSPLTLIIATAPMPGGVALATMISCLVFNHTKVQTKNPGYVAGVFEKNRIRLFGPDQVNRSGYILLLFAFEAICQLIEVGTFRYFRSIIVHTSVPAHF
jgi:hypothetical protein